MKRIGKYEIAAELARGNMGVVYRARDTTLGRVVAIKLMRSSLRKDPVLRERFHREAEALARLSHPNVVRVHEIDEHEGATYLVTEFVEGESLQDRIARQGPLPEREAAAITLKLAQALASAHDHALLHRDVKPANVILDTEGAPRLTDFGLARDLEGSRKGLTKSGSSLGTPGYWAPEQAVGDLSKLGPHSDVYGLGATCYAMLVGKPPIEARNVAETLEALKHPPTPPRQRRPDLDPRLESICLKCLEPETTLRYPTMAALEADLQLFLNDRSVKAAQGAKVLRLRSWLLRYSAAVLLGAVGLGAVAVVLAAGLWSRPAAPLPSHQSHRGGEAPGAAADPKPKPEQSELPEYVQRAWTLAREKAATNGHEAAIEQYRFVLRELKPDSPLEAQLRTETATVFIARARAKIEKGVVNAKSIHEDLERAAEAAPESPETHTLRGEVYWLAGSRTVGFLEGPGPSESNFERNVREGSEKRAAVRFRLARTALQRALDLDPNQLDARALLGGTLYFLGRLDDAKRELDRVLADRPTHAESLFYRGCVVAKLGDDAAALLDFSAAEASYGDTTDRTVAHYRSRALLARAQAHQRLGDRDAAIADCRRVLELFESTSSIGVRARGMLEALAAPPSHD